MAAKPNPALASIQRKQRLNCHLWSWTLSPLPPREPLPRWHQVGVAWGTLAHRQRHTAIHLRLLDVLGGGVAAHPQRFVVVDHDVSCPTGSLQGEKAKSGTTGTAWQCWVWDSKGRLLTLSSAPATPLPPESNSVPKSHAQLPSTLRTPRPPGSTDSPSRGPFAADAPPTRRRHPSLPSQGERGKGPRCRRRSRPASPGAQWRGGGRREGAAR